MKVEKQKAKEQLVIAEFVKLCQPSINPDLYSALIDDIIPVLRESRQLTLRLKHKD